MHIATWSSLSEFAERSAESLRCVAGGELRLRAPVPHGKTSGPGWLSKGHVRGPSVPTGSQPRRVRG